MKSIKFKESKKIVMDIQHYINEINREFVKGNSTEHTFRGTLKNLLESLCGNIDATNEPKKTEGGNPDYQITKKGTRIPVAFIEAKDIGKDLNDKKYKGQFNRYKKAYDNLIITDYLNFQFFEKKKLIFELRLAEVIDGKVKSLNNNFKEFEDYIKPFFDKPSITIKSSKKLAEMMAARARVLHDQIEGALLEDIKTENRFSKLYGHFHNFKRLLIHDLDEKQFSDLFAQTLAYGLFAARLYDKTPENFSRQEAAELIPSNNPFLKELFADIAGPSIDQRIERTLDNLADVFRYTDIEKLLKDFGKSTKTHDPIIHFYETFLTEYDKGLKKDRGVWYTPEPVVEFIIKSVDEILRSEFDIKDGLADTSKVIIKKDVLKLDARSKSKSTITGTAKVDQEVHKVQILDPAVGTGTFLAKVIEFVYRKKFKNQEGIWNSYVENDLIPRLNGFELLMAPYSMAHVKLAMLLKETGYKSDKNTRFNVFLTNSLEEYDEKQADLFSPLLSEESSLANSVKRDTPVMCVIGNPPYSGESSNKGKWIMDLMGDYKKEPGGKEKLKEKNPKWINDDYVKFLRYGQHYIERNESGVLAFINPHGFLDNPTFRGMRWNLLKTYDKIYTIDLHGNSKKKETAPDGSPDINVFDIQQGVSINLFVKTGKKKGNELGKVFHYDLFGKRDFKYDFLNKKSIQNIDFIELPNSAPMYFMVQKDFEAQASYEKGVSVSKLFSINNVGIVTSRDSFVIDEKKPSLSKRMADFFILEKDLLKSKYGLKENKSWKIDDVKKQALEFEPDDINKISYRPFDNRFLYYNNDFIERSRIEVMQHFVKGENIGLILSRQPLSLGSPETVVAFCSKNISDLNIYRRGGGTICPLYLYPETNGQQTIEQSIERKPNLKAEIVNEFAEKLGLKFTNEKETNKDTFAPIDILDYIYAVLHSPSYREKYKEFLKIDFPRVPYPEDQDTFWKLVKLGGEIRQIHLLESATVEQYITQYPIAGDNLVSRKMSKNSPGYVPNNGTHGKVYINDEQYFDNVPLVAWEFYVGGYQPAQKWLKDRNGRKLEWEDIAHYQKIIVALSETDRIMKEIDEIKI